jgi:hypothetical protein
VADAKVIAGNKDAVAGAEARVLAVGNDTRDVDAGNARKADRRMSLKFTLEYSAAMTTSPALSSPSVVSTTRPATVPLS